MLHSYICCNPNVFGHCLSGGLVNVLPRTSDHAGCMKSEFNWLDIFNPIIRWLEPLQVCSKLVRALFNQLFACDLTLVACWLAFAYY
jgi:hypothetical protein